MEPRFGADFSDVQIYETPDLANAIQAQAFTHGQDIYFNSGKYNPVSNGGKKLLAHELTHVIQQLNISIHRQPTQTHAVTSVQQYSNIDDAVRQWMGTRDTNFIRSRYRNPVTREQPEIVSFKYWSLASSQGVVNYDIHFLAPDREQQNKHVKVRITFSSAGEGVKAEAKLYDWLGSMPVEMFSWVGTVVTQTNNTCQIVDQESTPREAPSNRFRRRRQIPV